MPLVDDIRFAVRQLLRSPGFTIAAIVTLALGIGANTAFFAAVNAVVFRPVRAMNLEHVWHPRVYKRSSQGSMDAVQFRLLEADLPAGVEAADARGGGTVLAHVPGRAELVAAEFVSGGHAAVFDLRPQAGRFISHEDDRSGRRTVVISDRLWRQWFGGDAAIIEKTVLRIDKYPYEIVGVAPHGYRGNAGWGLGSTDLWVALKTSPAASNTLRMGVFVTVRLSADADPADVGARMHAVVEPSVPMNRGPFDVRLEPVTSADGLRGPGIMLLTFSSLILLAACANLANMLYTRAAHRAAEVAVRQSLGATAARIFRSFLIEALLIALTASTLGLALALTATRLLHDAFPSFQDRATRVSIDLSPDYRVFLYALGAGIGAALIVGVLTAWKASRVPPLLAMSRGDGATSITQASRRVRLSLVALQVTASVVLLMGAGLYLRQTHAAFENLLTFDTRPIGSARVELSRHGYTDTRAHDFLQQTLAGMRALPGVQHAALADGIPGAMLGAGANVTMAAERLDLPPTRYLDSFHKRTSGSLISVSSGFLETLGLPLEAGRDFTARDVDGAPLVVMLSRNAAALLLGSDAAIGRRVMIGNEGHWRTVVGIFANPARVKENVGPKETRAANVMLVPWEQRHQPPLHRQQARYDQRYQRQMLLFIRSAEVRGQLDALSAAVSGVDPGVALFDAAPVDESMLSWVGPLRAARLLMVSLAVLALAITVVGIYSVLAFLVSRRTREFGIRMALGAQRRQVLKMVFDEATFLLLVGLLSGVFVAVLGERMLLSSRAGLPPNEISTWAFVLVLIFTVGLAAGLIPARRASNIDPNAALRDL
ncbi:MAG: ABC transporter permease [Acidobacteriota bacterium]|nr:ABC transporter permease [Acidobacteriota bacterium]